MLLSVMNQHSQAYDLYQHQCYWYAHTIWKVLKKAFPDAFETDEAAGRSSYCGLTIKKADSVEEVYNEFCLERRNAEQREADKRREREEEAQQLRMEGRTEGQAEERARWKAEVEQARREKEEARREKEEAVRRAEEVERRAAQVRAELQAEIDRMRAQYERHAV
ncbi:hypothetical protein BDR04DRAFT_578815 [Suillus decipiens]|nr:hypothetical protein BDR04DRAFT_578815 [Suillus decipiens]